MINRLEKLEEAYKELSRVKKVRGYQYGVTDCFSLFTLYDSKINKQNKLHGLIKNYSTHIAFHRAINKLGYSDYKDLILSNGYEEIEFEKVATGDVCVFNSPVVDFTIAIYTGDYWLNSSDSPKYEKLPSRFVKPRATFTCKLRKDYEKF